MRGVHYRPRSGRAPSDWRHHLE